MFLPAALLFTEKLWAHMGPFYIETVENRSFLRNPGACPVGPADRTGVVKIFAFRGLAPRLNNNLTRQTKLNIFQRPHIGGEINVRFPEPERFTFGS